MIVVSGVSGVVDTGFKLAFVRFNPRPCVGTGSKPVLSISPRRERREAWSDFVTVRGFNPRSPRRERLTGA